MESIFYLANRSPYFHSEMAGEKRGNGSHFFDTFRQSETKAETSDKRFPFSEAISVHKGQYAGEADTWLNWLMEIY